MMQMAFPSLPEHTHSPYLTLTFNKIVGRGLEDQLKFIYKWMKSHIDDGDKELRKPVLFAEFGLSKRNKNFQPSQRETFYKAVFDIIYKLVRKNRSGACALAWQFMAEGMEEYNDDNGIVPWERPSMYRLITQQSCRLSKSCVYLADCEMYFLSLHLVALFSI